MGTTRIGKCFIVVWMVALTGFGFGCGGENAAEQATSSNGSTEIEPQPSERLGEDEEAIQEGEAVCAPLVVTGSILVGEQVISMEGTTFELASSHTEGCIAGVDVALTTPDGCVLRFSATSPSETGWTVDTASIEGCTPDAGDHQFQADASTFGLLARPDVDGDGACLPADALAMAGRLVFTNATGDVPVTLDGFTLGGSFDSVTGTGLVCSPIVNTCVDASCGQDPFGVECGECGEGFACFEGTCQEWNCPPEGPFGTAIGDTVLNLEMKDCDGNWHSLQDLCGAPAGLFNLLAGY